jgi:hypothetical protein
MKRVLIGLVPMFLLIGLHLPCGVTAAGNYAPTSDYTVRHVEGWKVLVNNELSSGHADLAEDVLELLRYQLYQIVRAVPTAAVQELRRVPIWIEYNDPRHKCMCYHPSREWLTEHDFNPEKAGSVEIANCENFLTWTLDQPWMVLHEMAHGYHHLVLSHGNPQVSEAYEKAVKSKSYESVLHYSEYFAEGSEAYFGTNDFYPFVSAELKQHDPHMYELLEKLWGREKPQP